MSGTVEEILRNDHHALLNEAPEAPHIFQTDEPGPAPEKPWSTRTLFAPMGWKPETIAPRPVTDHIQVFSTHYPVAHRTLMRVNGDLEVENRNNLRFWAAGGSVARCFEPEIYGRPEDDVGDVDFYLVGDLSDSNHVADAIDNLVSSLGKEVMSVSKYRARLDSGAILSRGALTFLTTDGQKFQLILRDYADVSALLRGFDVTVAMVAFDGHQFATTPLGEYSLRWRTIVVDPVRHSETYPSRLVRYFNRGFALALPPQTQFSRNVKKGWISSQLPIRLTHLTLRIKHRGGDRLFTGDLALPHGSITDGDEISSARSDYEPCDLLFGGKNITAETWYHADLHNIRQMVSGKDQFVKILNQGGYSLLYRGVNTVGRREPLPLYFKDPFEKHSALPQELRKRLVLKAVGPYYSSAALRTFLGMSEHDIGRVEQNEDQALDGHVAATMLVENAVGRVLKMFQERSREEIQWWVAARDRKDRLYLPRLAEAPYELAAAWLGRFHIRGKTTCLSDVKAVPLLPATVDSDSDAAKPTVPAPAKAGEEATPASAQAANTTKAASESEDESEDEDEDDDGFESGDGCPEVRSAAKAKDGEMVTIKLPGTKKQIRMCIVSRDARE